VAVESGRVVEIEQRIDAPREEVFVYLTDPVKYTKWKGMAAELDPRPGGVYRVRMNSDTVALGEYVAVEPRRAWFSRGGGRETRRSLPARPRWRSRCGRTGTGRSSVFVIRGSLLTKPPRAIGRAGPCTSSA